MSKRIVNVLVVSLIYFALIGLILTDALAANNTTFGDAGATVINVLVPLALTLGFAFYVGRSFGVF